MAKEAAEILRRQIPGTANPQSREMLEAITRVLDKIGELEASPRQDLLETLKGRMINFIGIRRILLERDMEPDSVSGLVFMKEAPAFHYNPNIKEANDRITGLSHLLATDMAVSMGDMVHELLTPVVTPSGYDIVGSMDPLFHLNIEHSQNNQPNLITVITADINERWHEQGGRILEAYALRFGNPEDTKFPGAVLITQPQRRNR